MPPKPICWVKDSRRLAWEEMSCEQAVVEYDRLVEAHPFSHPFVHGMTVDVPHAPVRAAKGAFIDGRRVALATHVDAYAPTRQPPVIDPSAGIQATEARALLVSCASRSDASPQTVSIAIFSGDDLIPAALALLASVIGLLSMLRRRVRVEVDPALGRVTIVERDLVREIRRVAVGMTDIAEVTVALGASGALNGHRVELGLHDGSRVPLTEAFSAFSGGTSRRFARRLGAALGLRAAEGS